MNCHLHCINFFELSNKTNITKQRDKRKPQKQKGKKQKKLKTKPVYIFGFVSFREHFHFLGVK